jgi:hypothetical protein
MPPLDNGSPIVFSTSPGDGSDVGLGNARESHPPARNHIFRTHI